jgi:hypothetical protein
MPPPAGELPGLKAGSAASFELTATGEVTVRSAARRLRDQGCPERPREARRMAHFAPEWKSESVIHVSENAAALCYGQPLAAARHSPRESSPRDHG